MSNIGEQLNGCYSDMTSDSQHLNISDSDTPSVRHLLESCDGDTSSVSKHYITEYNSEYEHNEVSAIFQCDGAASVCSSSSELSSQYSSEDEFDANPVQAVLVPAPDQPSPGQPLVLTVDPTGKETLPLSLPLFLVLNARSLYNKAENFKRFLREIAPSCALVSETW